MLKVDIGSVKIYVGLKGGVPPIIDGKFPYKIKPDETVWTIESGGPEGGKTLQMVLEKFDGMKWWESAIQGDEKIDTSKIEPESSKLSDLDPETRSTVEKMMLNQ